VPEKGFFRSFTPRALAGNFAELEPSEWQQGVIRLVIIAIVGAYLLASGVSSGAFSPREAATLEVLGAYSVFALAVMASFRRWPGRNFVRRSATLVTDLGVTTLVAWLGGELLAPFFAIYLWLALGYGIRYGQRFLLAGTVLGALGFASVLANNPYWIASRPAGLGMLLTLVIIPIFVSVLLRKSEAAKREAERANRAKTQFLANMSHEIRTPLTGIIGMAELLARARLESREREQVQTITVAARLLLGLLEDLLDIAKIEAGKVTLNETAFDLDALIGSVTATVYPRAAEKGLRLHVNVSPHVPSALRGDPLRLEQVLLNLAGNAVKFTETGYVALRVEHAGAGAARVRLRFEVADSGIGIEASEQARIFEPFAQVDASATRRHGGSGLGTSIARQLVERMGGTMGVASEPGRGSVFWFELPFKAASAEERPPAAGYLSRRLLVLSIDEDVLGRLRAIAGAWRLQMATAAEGDLPATLRRGRWDVVVVDADHPALEPAAVARAFDTDARPGAVALVLLHRDGDAHRRRPEYAPYRVVLDRGSPPRVLDRALRAALAGVPEETPPPTPERRGLRILVAEDSPIGQKVIRSMLEDAGHAMTLARDGGEALERLSEATFDCAVVDMQMPVLDGLDVVRIARFANPERARMPFIVLTADATTEVERRCCQAGVDLHLTKPVAREALLDALERVTSEQARPPGGGAPRAALCHRAVIESWRELGGTEVRETLLADAAQALEACRAAQRERDHEGFREAAHALAVRARRLGGERLAALARAAEAVSPELLEGFGAAIVSELAHTLARTREKVRAGSPAARRDEVGAAPAAAEARRAD